MEQTQVIYLSGNLNGYNELPQFKGGLRPYFMVASQIISNTNFITSRSLCFKQIMLVLF